MEDIQRLLDLEIWKDDKFKDLLTSSVVAKSKSILNKLPISIEIAETFEIDKCLNTNFLLFSPSRNYAIIQYLKHNNLVKLVKYLESEGIYYSKDIVLTSLDLFLLDEKDFIKRFERLKEKLGIDYVNKLGEDSSLIELMYN